MKNRSFVEWMYSTKTGRAFLKIMLYSGILKAAEKIARSPFSRPYIKKFIKSNNIDMSDFKGQTYYSFQDFSPVREKI